LSSTVSLLPGDIVLIHSTPMFSSASITRWLLTGMDIVDGKANHAAFYMGDNKFLESNFDGINIHYKEWLNPLQSGFPKQNYAILRLKGITDRSRRELIYAATAYYHEKKDFGYSYFGLAMAAISALFGMLSLGPSRKRFKPTLPNEPAPFCSELVAEIYTRFNGMKFKYALSVLSPNDLYRDNRFVKILDFDGGVVY
jgi:hypothetical protein